MAHASAQDAPPPADPAEAPDKPVAEGDPPPLEESSTGMAGVAALLPIGKVTESVIFPTFDKVTRQRTSTLLASSVVRVDDQFLDLTDMTIQLYNTGADEPGLAAPGAPVEHDFSIRLKTAKYDIASEELFSRDQSVIEGKSFTITGDEFVYWPKTQTAALKGNIRMVITDFAKFTPEPPATETPSHDSDPAATESEASDEENDNSDSSNS